ncbi:MAG: SDR family oxidoreductase [Deltaproteobacteria bacterium]|nr:SDR family oxidoreductase [Deltaproteobacteria bacterium]
MKGRTALVTGGSRGIGAAIAGVFERNGARVIAPTREQLDLASDTSIDDYIESLREPVDILVNNAGINRLGALDEIGHDDFREVLQINLMSALRLIRGIARGMQSRRYGRIVNVSSVWAFVSRLRRITYAASKAGLDGLTRAVALELAPNGILVNSVAPGYVDTELTRKNNAPEEIAVFKSQIPVGRLAAPEEIAEAVAFLCSARNTYMTGQTLIVDGGYVCK